MNGITLHPSSIPVIAERHGGRDDERDTALRSHELFRAASHVVAIQCLHGAGRELVSTLWEDVVERLAAAPDLDADVPTGGDHDAKRLVSHVDRSALRTAGVEQRAHDVGMTINGPFAKLGDFPRHGDGLD